MTIGWGLIILLILGVICGLIIYFGQYTDYSGYIFKYYLKSF